MSGTGSGVSAGTTNYFMNGYQGPLNTSDFSGYTTAQGFIPMAAVNGQREIELSRIAQEKARSPQVRSFAAMMIADHSKSNQELVSMAPSKNVSLSGSLTGTQYGSNTYSGTGTSGSVSAQGSMGTTNSMNHANGTMGSVNASGSAGTTGGTGTTGSMDHSSGTMSTTGSSVGAGSTSGSMGATGSGSVSGTGAANGGSMSGNNTVSGNATTGNSGSTGYYSGSAGMSGTTGQSGYDMISLQNLTGQAFDVQYMRMMLQDHAQAIAMFTRASQSSDPEVRAFAKKNLPALQAHFSHARGVNRIAHQ
jgi:predicted outer membrane protein